ncbi:hypothetical protein PTKIN_Ptkin13bG0140300 [Pterospermum kingtungense]
MPNQVHSQGQSLNPMPNVVGQNFNMQKTQQSSMQTLFSMQSILLSGFQQSQQYSLQQSTQLVHKEKKQQQQSVGSIGIQQQQQTPMTQLSMMSQQNAANIQLTEYNKLLKQQQLQLLQIMAIQRTLSMMNPLKMGLQSNISRLPMGSQLGSNSSM